MKTCGKCGQVKALAEFHARSDREGTHNSCKTCWREASKQWYQKNRERHLSNGRAWARKNPEKVRKISRRYYKLHPERFQARRKRYWQENLEKNRAACRKWRAENLEYSRAKVREWNRQHLPRVAAKLRTWRKKNPERAKAIDDRKRAKRAKALGTATFEQIKARIDFYGNRCAYCGGPYEHVDHVIPLARGGSNWPANLRPACARCNQSKNAKKLSEWRVLCA